jgi:hypothetical protein
MGAGAAGSAKACVGRACICPCAGKLINVNPQKARILTRSDFVTRFCCTCFLPLRLVFVEAGLIDRLGAGRYLFLSQDRQHAFSFSNDCAVVCAWRFGGI